VIKKVKNWILHHYAGFLNKRKRIPKRQSKMDSPAKLAT